LGISAKGPFADAVSERKPDDITEIDPEIRGIVERNWPHLLAKLPPDQ
jgi:hypothetical protein